MAGPALAEPGNAGLALEFCRNGGEYGFRIVPLRPGAADHDRGAMARAFGATGNADAEISDALGLQVVETALRVAEERVATFKDRVALIEQWQKLLDHVVDRLAGLDHDDDGTWLLHRLYEGDEIGLGQDAFGKALSLRCLDEGVDPGGGAVVDGDRMAFFSDVQGKVCSHHAKADQADIRFRHASSLRFVKRGGTMHQTAGRCIIARWKELVS